MIRTTLITIILLQTLPSVRAQILPTIELDSMVRTSEFYSWTYDEDREIHGYWGTYWIFDSDFKLYLGQSSHHPVARSKRMVGSWIIEKDSVVLTISSPKKMGLKEPTTIKYRIFQFEWTTNTELRHKDTGALLFLRSVAIILSNNPDFNAMDVKEKLNKYVADNCKPAELSREEEALRNWDVHRQMENMVRQYFNSEKTPIGIKQYRNKNLLAR